MGLVRIAAYEAARGVARGNRGARRQQKPRAWQPFTKLVWWVMILGTLWFLGPVGRMIFYVFCGLIGMVILVLVVATVNVAADRKAAAKGQPQPRPRPQDPIGAYLADLDNQAQDYSYLQDGKRHKVDPARIRRLEKENQVGPYADYLNERQRRR